MSAHRYAVEVFHQLTGLTLDDAHKHVQAKNRKCPECGEPAAALINSKCADCANDKPDPPRSFDNSRLPVPVTCSGCGTMYTGSCPRCMYDPSDDDWRLTMFRNR